MENNKEIDCNFMPDNDNRNINTKVYQIKIIAQFEQYEGWADKQPKPTYLKKNVLVKSNKDSNELSAYLRANVKNYNHIWFIVDSVTKVQNGAMSEDEFIQRMSYAKLEIIF